MSQGIERVMIVDATIVAVLQAVATIVFGCFFATFAPLLVMVARHALRGPLDIG